MASKRSEYPRSKLRARYESFFLPVGKALGRTGLSPNQITLLSIGVAVVAAYILLKDLLLGFTVFLVAFLLDMLDGSVARATGKTTKFGKLLDHYSDRIVEFLLILSLALAGYIPGWLALLAYFGMISPSYIRARGESVFEVSGESVGLFERKEKLSTIIIAFIIKLSGLEEPLFSCLEHVMGTQIEPKNIFYWALLVVAILSLITAVQRLLFFYRVQNSQS